MKDEYIRFLVQKVSVHSMYLLYNIGKICKYWLEVSHVFVCQKIRQIGLAVIIFNLFENIGNPNFFNKIKMKSEIFFISNIFKIKMDYII